MKRPAPHAAAAVKSASDRIAFIIPSAKKRKLRARLLMEGCTLTAFALLLSEAYADKRKIEIDGKPLEELLKER